MIRMNTASANFVLIDIYFEPSSKEHSVNAETNDAFNMFNRCPQQFVD